MNPNTPLITSPYFSNTHADIEHYQVI